MNVNGEKEKVAGAVAPAPTGDKAAKEQMRPRDSIGEMIERLKPQLARALPKHVTSERLARVALTAVRNNPKLAQADAMSLMGSIMTAAQLGLEPNTPLGQCADGKEKWMMQASFQMGYKGIIDLAHRSGQYRQITAHAVDEADKFSYEYGLNPSLIHVPAVKPSGKVVYYYAVYQLVNGGFDFRVWSRDRVQAHAEKYSKTWDAEKKRFFYASAWADAFDSMGCKTVLIDLLRYAPKSVEIALAASADSRTLTINPDDPDLNIDAEDADFEITGEAAE
jgi:recombination protein RecT